MVKRVGARNMAGTDYASSCFGVIYGHPAVI